MNNKKYFVVCLDDEIFEDLKNHFKGEYVSPFEDGDKNLSILESIWFTKVLSSKKINILEDNINVPGDEIIDGRYLFPKYSLLRRILRGVGKSSRILYLEYPESYLSPSEVANLARCLMAIKKELVYIIKTNSDHFLNILCYANHIGVAEGIVVFDKNKVVSVEGGDFVDEEKGEVVPFKKGWYDATIQEISEIEKGKYE